MKNIKSLSLAALFFSVAIHGRLQGSLFLTGGYVDYAGGSAPIGFTLTFNRTPDFLTVDSFNRQADAFQFYIGTSTNIPIGNAPLASLVRGGEIHVAGDIPIRDQSPPSGDPNSGGWGPIRGSVSYSLTGQTLTFSVPASLLNVSSPFGYELLLTTYGATSADYLRVSGGPIVVPEPSTISLALLGLGFIFWQVRRSLPNTY